MFTIMYHFWVRIIMGNVSKLFKVHYTQGWFQERKFEKALYKLLRVKEWKGKALTYNPESFSFDHHTPQRIVANMCQAEVVHEVIILFSFLPLFAAIPFGEFPVFLLTSLFAALVDTMFVIMQRYNRPRLMELRDRREARAKRHKTEE